MSIIIVACLSCMLCFILFIITGLFKHSLLPIESIKELPKVSVVIAARNEEMFIPNLIQDLVNQEYPLDKLEVIIVNDRSTDATKEILKKADENYALIKTITVEESSNNMTPKKYALTQGIESAEGEIIVLTDADCRVGKLWVASMVYSVLSKNCISIGFSEIGLKNRSLFEEYQYIDFLSIIAANAGSAGWGQFWSGTGQNLAFYKEDFFKINGFEPVRDRISGDDMYLVQSISKLKKGYVNIDPNSFVETAAMPTLKEFINQRVRWSSNSKLNASENPLFFSFLSTMFTYNIIIIISFFFGGPWLLLFLLKFILEGLVIFLGSKLFNRKINFLPFCLWSIAQPIYIPLVGILGLKEKFNWKP